MPRFLMQQADGMPQAFDRFHVIYNTEDDATVAPDDFDRMNFDIDGTDYNWGPAGVTKSEDFVTFVYDGSLATWIESQGWRVAYISNNPEVNGNEVEIVFDVFGEPVESFQFGFLRSGQTSPTASLSATRTSYAGGNLAVRHVDLAYTSNDANQGAPGGWTHTNAGNADWATVGDAEGIPYASDGWLDSLVAFVGANPNTKLLVVDRPDVCIPSALTLSSPTSFTKDPGGLLAATTWGTAGHPNPTSGFATPQGLSVPWQGASGARQRMLDAGYTENTPPLNAAFASLGQMPYFGGIDNATKVFNVIAWVMNVSDAGWRAARIEQMTAVCQALGQIFADELGESYRSSAAGILIRPAKIPEAGVVSYGTLWHEEFTNFPANTTGPWAIPGSTEAYDIPNDNLYEMMEGVFAMASEAKSQMPSGLVTAFTSQSIQIPIWPSWIPYYRSQWVAVNGGTTADADGHIEAQMATMSDTMDVMLMRGSSTGYPSLAWYDDILDGVAQIAIRDDIS